MTIVDAFFGKTQEIKDAEHDLVVNENKVFELQEGEDHDLAIHVRADVPRFRVLNSRGALLRAESKQISNRTLLALVILGALLVADRHLPWAEVFKFLGL